MKASADSYPPVWAKIAARTATPKTPPDLPDRVVTRPTPCPRRAADRGEDDVRDRGEEQRHPDPGDDEGTDQRRVGDVGVETAAIQASPIACKRQADLPTNGLPPIRSDSAPAIGEMNIGIAVHGRIRKPASSGE